MGSQLTFRLATKDDAKLYFDWANDNEVRKQSHNTEPLVWENHLRWFNKKVESDSLLLVFFDGGTPIGQFRVDDGIIDLSVDNRLRGKGFGIEMLVAVKSLAARMKFKILCGEVKASNTPSNKAFEKAGYKLESVKEIHNVTCNVYTSE